MFSWWVELPLCHGAVAQHAKNPGPMMEHARPALERASETYNIAMNQQ